jgi:hypothetical protein
MSDRELRASNYNYDAAAPLGRVCLFARDAEILGESRDLGQRTSETF